jgi:hypothetical protein
MNGNLTNDGRFAYTWDGENRLTMMQTLSSLTTPGLPHEQVLFTYDWQGRRVSKKHSVIGEYTYRYDHRFVYDGWNLVAELNIPPGGATTNLVRSYVWGLDLSGSEQGAGGVRRDPCSFRSSSLRLISSASRPASPPNSSALSPVVFSAG